MDLEQAILDSWDRQCAILTNVSTLITDNNRHFLPSPDGWPLDKQLAHVHEVRYWWLKDVAPDLADAIGESFQEDGKTPLADLNEMRTVLKKSEAGVKDGVLRGLRAGVDKKYGSYDHPILFLQHMIWHEGWHIGLIMLALRLNGQEPKDVWEEENVWGQWRTEEWE